jgi:Fic family protein
MHWNWELPEWPKFNYDPNRVSAQEKQFLLEVGSASAYLKTIESQEYKRFIVEILISEGIESSKIEGEFLNRESLQSSIQKHFGLQTKLKSRTDKESQMADLLCNVYESFDQPLTHEMLWHWHRMLFGESARIDEQGKYRTHPEPMQIVSNRFDSQKVFFEAPPSKKIPHEMDMLIKWFNSSSGSILTRAAVAHVYFESIHPFEDGNGRLGRLLSEKILSQGVGRPVLIAISKILEKRKKEYYAALERCNRTLDIDHWVEFFANVVIQAQGEAMSQLYFLIEKSKMLNALSDQLNPRQTKALLRIFAEGLDGFKEGLSAENYISITKATRATATRDLADLVQKGALVKTGQLRHTRYFLNIPFLTSSPS